MFDHCPVCDALLVSNETHCRACAAPITGKLSSLPLRMRWLVRTRRLVLVNCVVCMVPAFMMAFPMEAVVGGPIVLLCGLALVAAGVRSRYPAARNLGLIQCAACLVFVAAWAMAQLDRRLAFISVMLSLLGVCALYFGGLWVWHHHPGRELRWQCDRCGYLLHGLARSRCPECGTAFDPARVA